MPLNVNNDEENFDFDWLDYKTNNEENDDMWECPQEDVEC